jgi:hypothetical protein
MRVTDDMVSRFLTWRLPDDFSPDCGVSFARVHPNGVTRYEPVGTNLLTAAQAKAMLEHVLGAGQGPMTREWCAAFPATAAAMINELAQRVDAATLNV